MATTYELISSNVLTGSAASVTFSSIPATYTDLCFKISARSDASAGSDTLKITFNSITTGYSFIRLIGTGSVVASGASATAQIDYINTNSDTANTFGNADIYIPSYAVSQFKPISGTGVSENNATNAITSIYTSIWINYAAITSITFESINAGNFVANSSFYLYGIKNS